MLCKAERSEIQMEELFAEVVILYLCFEDGLANVFANTARCEKNKRFRVDQQTGPGSSVEEDQED